MILSINDKSNIVDNIHKLLSSALSVVIANYHGVNANEINTLRKDAYQQNVNIFIIKNTLINRAIKKNNNFKYLFSLFSGPTLIACSSKHPGIAARLLHNFSKITKLEIKLACFNGNIIHKSEIKYLVDMPTYEEAIINIITLLKEASLLKLIRLLNFIKNNRLY
ncbi:MAG: 50S ribosomal protein L10 [Candidatus Lightella neohaematopini]|nr:50S ribosomal protein L10 [Candidatus Lightella neohaematopini]